MCLITLSMPIYNVEKYVERALISALNQTYQELEVLIVDDLGHDKSMEIVHLIKKTHIRGNCIRIITHQKNIGLGGTRNTAIEHARGKYLYFMDSDDAITPDCIESLYNIISKEKVDFVAAGVSINEKRKKTMDFSHEYVNSTEVIVVNGKNPAISGAVKGESLNGKVVAVQQGNIADSWVSDEEKCKPKEVKRYTKFAQASEDLKNNKVDCIVMDKYPAEKLVAENKELKILDGVLFEDKYAIAVKKGNKELLDEINKVIDKLIADGKIKEFTANHTQK